MKACRQLCPWNKLYGCKKPVSEPCILSNMPCESFEMKPQTNADRIRSMSDEELAELLQDCCRGATHDAHECSEMSCFDCRMDWLSAPYEEGK